MTKKDLLRLLLALIDATSDYKALKSIISDEKYLDSLIQNGRIDKEYLTFVIDELISKAKVAQADAKKIKNELRREGSFTIKRLVFLVHKYQN